MNLNILEGKKEGKKLVDAKYLNETFLLLKYNYEMIFPFSSNIFYIFFRLTRLQELSFTMEDEVNPVLKNKRAYVKVLT